MSRDVSPTKHDPPIRIEAQTSDQWRSLNESRDEPITHASSDSWFVSRQNQSDTTLNVFHLFDTATQQICLAGNDTASVNTKLVDIVSTHWQTNVRHRSWATSSGRFVVSQGDNFFFFSPESVAFLLAKFLISWETNVSLRQNEKKKSQKEAAPISSSTRQIKRLRPLFFASFFNCSVSRCWWIHYLVLQWTNPLVSTDECLPFVSSHQSIQSVATDELVKSHDIFIQSSTFHLFLLFYWVPF